MKKRLSGIIICCIIAAIITPLIAFAANVPPITFRVVDSAGVPLANSHVIMTTDPTSSVVTYDVVTDANGIATFPVLPLESLYMTITDSARTEIAKGQICFFIASKTAIKGYTENHYEITVNQNASQVGIVVMTTNGGGIVIPTVSDNAQPAPAPSSLPTPTPSQVPNNYNIKAYLITPEKISLPDYYATIDNVTKAQSNGDGAVYLPDIDDKTHTLKVFNKDDKQVGAINFQLYPSTQTVLYGKNSDDIYEVKVKTGINNVYMYVEVNEDSIAITKASEQQLKPGAKPSEEPLPSEDVITQPIVNGYFTQNNGAPIYPATITLKNLDTFSSLDCDTGISGSYSLSMMSVGNNQLIAKHSDGKESCTTEFMVERAEKTSITVKDNKPLISLRSGATQAYMNFICDGKGNIMITGVSDEAIDPPKYNKPIEVPTPQPTQPLASFVLNGMLTDAHGKAIPNQGISLNESSDTTNKNGLFVVSGLNYNTLYTVSAETKNGIVTYEQYFKEGEQIEVVNNVITLPSNAQSVYVTYQLDGENLKAVAAAQNDFLPAEGKDIGNFVIWIIVAIAGVAVIAGVILLSKKSR